MADQVITTELPRSSRLRARVRPGDFVDCYAVRASIPPRRAIEIITSFPGWARALLLLRRVMTTPFGLLNDGPPAADKIGPFPVESETPDEIIAGFDDRHLDFRVSVMLNDGVVTLGTWVHTHNVGGCVYLRGILPFHVLISRDALTRVAKAAS